jgi:WD40 repeat protein/mono/diheme cytochrome c family protein
MPRYLFIWIALFSSVPAEEKPTYDDHVFPIFQQSCLNCHNPDKSKGGLDLSTFNSALKGGSGGKIVEAGDMASVLISAVLQSGEKKMPPEGEKLGMDQINTLQRWIEGGLLENKSSPARKPSKPKFETTLRSNPAAKPDGPPPMPQHLLLQPPVVTSRPAAIHAIAASPWAPLLAVTGQRQILLHHTESLELIGILPFPEGDPISLAFTPDGRYLIVGGGIGGKSGVTVTFDVTSGERLLTAAREFDTVLAADIRPNFDIVATGGPSRLLKIWNTETGELTKSIKKHTDWITALDLSADGVLLASGDRNGGVWVWESQTMNEFHTLRGHQTAITATVFRADSNILATSSEDGTVRFWEMNGGNEVKKIDAHPGGVTAFAFAPDGSSVTAGRDFKVKFWKPDFNHARDLAKDLAFLPTAVALDTEAKRAFVADSQGAIRVFKTYDSTQVGEIHGNPPTIESRLQKLALEIFKNNDNSLKIKFKHWFAAAINTKAIETRNQAGQSETKLVEFQNRFLLSANKLASKAVVLNTKRSEHRQLERLLEKHSSPEVTAEIQATLVALDFKIQEALAELNECETEQLGFRDSIEQTAPITQQIQAAVVSFVGAYQKALAPSFQSNACEQDHER